MALARSDEVIEMAARAANLEAGRQRGLAFEDDWDIITEQERGGWRHIARAVLGACDLPAVIASVGDDSPDLHKQIFRLYAAAEDVLMEAHRGRPMGPAMDRLGAAIAHLKVADSDA